MIPCRFLDELEIGSYLLEGREMLFRMEHTVRQVAQDAFVGSESRFMSSADPDDPAQLRGVVASQALRDALAAMR